MLSNRSGNVSLTQADLKSRVIGVVLHSNPTYSTNSRLSTTHLTRFHVNSKFLLGPIISIDHRTIRDWVMMKINHSLFPINFHHSKSRIDDETARTVWSQSHRVILPSTTCVVRCHSASGNMRQSARHDLSCTCLFGQLAGEIYIKGDLINWFLHWWGRIVFGVGRIASWLHHFQVWYMIVSSQNNDTAATNKGCDSCKLQMPGATYPFSMLPTVCKKFSCATL